MFFFSIHILTQSFQLCISLHRLKHINLCVNIYNNISHWVAQVPPSLIFEVSSSQKSPSYACVFICLESGELCCYGPKWDMGDTYESIMVTNMGLQSRGPRECWPHSPPKIQWNFILTLKCHFLEHKHHIDIVSWIKLTNEYEKVLCIKLPHPGAWFGVHQKPGRAESHLCPSLGRAQISFSCSQGWSRGSGFLWGPPPGRSPWGWDLPLPAAF